METRIDLHIHSSASDGRMGVEEIVSEAKKRGLRLISITDHDTLDAQGEAAALARRRGILYLHGVELSVSFPHPYYGDEKAVSLDFLGYRFDIRYAPLQDRLRELRAYREKRAMKILANINTELAGEGKDLLTPGDMKAIQDSVDGTFGRPHIADYLVKRDLVSSRQEAFDRYLVRCNVPKMPLSLEEASGLIRGAGGKLMLAHPNHPRGTSLIKLTASLREQQEIVREAMLPFIDGIECWHSAHDAETSESYLRFARLHGLMVTGGSDCHQQPLLIGTVPVPDDVAAQFGLEDLGR
ncbi:MAG: PHP domain-containing protein [Deltaproteobacteria bacterium]|nr:PHP domain-containing protein [Deltaproteobacteria bacterium]